jgi:hypothetical protein
MVVEDKLSCKSTRVVKDGVELVFKVFGSDVCLFAGLIPS